MTEPAAPVRHAVGPNDIEVVGIICLKCGQPVDTDGDWFWHIDPAFDELDPEDDPALSAAGVSKEGAA